MEQGIKLACITAIISGFSIFASKIFVSTMDPIVFTTLKNFLVVGVLSIGLLGSPLRFELTKLTKKQWGQLMIIGLIGGGIPFALFFTGLKMTSAVQGAIIQKTLFIWVALLAYWYLKERLNQWQILGYAIVTFGALWISSFKTFHLGIGECLILAATLLWSVEHVIAKKALKNIPSEIVAWARMTFGILVLFAILIYQGKTGIALHLSTAQLTSVMVGGGLLTGYVLTWYKALSKAPATIVSLVLASSPVITSLLTALFITRSIPTIPDMVTMVALAGGVALALQYDNKKQLETV